MSLLNNSSNMAEWYLIDFKLQSQGLEHRFPAIHHNKNEVRRYSSEAGCSDNIVPLLISSFAMEFN